MQNTKRQTMVHITYAKIRKTNNGLHNAMQTNKKTNNGSHNAMQKTKRQTMVHITLCKKNPKYWAKNCG